MDNHEFELEVIDTDGKLTKEELKELKRLASLSKTTRTLFAVAMGFVAIFGFDRLIDLIKH